MPRRQFYCQKCQKSPTERLSFREMKRNYTSRYEQYIYEKVKELTVEQVSKNEQLSPEQVQNIFSRLATRKKRLGKPISFKFRRIQSSKGTRKLGNSYQ